jgi:hypothetical protein
MNKLQRMWPCEPKRVQRKKTFLPSCVHNQAYSSNYIFQPWRWKAICSSEKSVPTQKLLHVSLKSKIVVNLCKNIKTSKLFRPLMQMIKIFKLMDDIERTICDQFKLCTSFTSHTRVCLWQEVSLNARKMLWHDAVFPSFHSFLRWRII